MALGKKISICLKDGTVTGIKIGEVFNQTIQAVSCPRNRLIELATYAEAKRPGVYFLFGVDEETNEAKSYIGEAENVYERLQDHLARKDFWREVIFFVSKDENLTKSHVKFLESRAIQLAAEIERYKLDNYNKPSLTSLPMADRDAMEEFLIYVKLLLGVLGHKILEEVTIKITDKRVIASPLDAPIPVRITDPSSASTVPSTLELFLNTGGLKATALRTDEGIVVLPGSEASSIIRDSLSTGYRLIRDQLLTNEVLVMDGTKLIFAKEHLFSTPSQAAGIIVGYSINGREFWKDKNGKSLKSIEELG